MGCAMVVQSVGNVGGFLVFKGKELGNNNVVCDHYWLEGEPSLVEASVSLRERVNSEPLD
jgi:hypothetical protein